jgi:hypothetical protein
MKQTGILHFANGRAFIGVPDEKQAESFKKQIGEGNYSWANRDYRQKQVNSNIEDAIPKPEDFLPFNFRHISATIVGGGTWKATDFSNEKVLKKVAGLLSNKPVMVNHEFETDNIVGANGDLKFVPSRTDDSGQFIPAGIEGPIWIDGKLHADICRKLAAFPVPHIQSVSITVVFEWEPSHDFKQNGEYDWYEFRDNLGQMVDGKMVCRVVTNVIECHETSLVWLGADPFAKILDSEGNPLNIEKSNVVSMSKATEDPLFSIYEKEGRLFVFDSEQSVKQVSFNKQNFSKTGDNGKNKEMNLIKLLTEKFGKTETELTADFIANLQVVAPTQKVVEATAYAKLETDLSEANTNLSTASKSLDVANTQLADYAKICKHEDVATLETEVGLENIIPFAKEQNQTLSAARVEAERLYKLSAGDKISNAMLSSIKTANLELANSYINQFGGKSLEVFGATCQKCGSKNISMRKSEPEGNSGATEQVIPSMAQYLHENK